MPRAALSQCWKIDPSEVSDGGGPFQNSCTEHGNDGAEVTQHADVGYCLVTRLDVARQQGFADRLNQVLVEAGCLSVAACEQSHWNDSSFQLLGKEGELFYHGRI